MKINLTIALISFIMLYVCFSFLGRMYSPQNNYLPSPDEVQQLINERLPAGYRIKQDGRIGKQTKQAWEFVLTPEEDRKYQDWDEFLKTIKISEIELCEK